MAEPERSKDDSPKAEAAPSSTSPAEVVGVEDEDRRDSFAAAKQLLKESATETDHDGEVLRSRLESMGYKSAADSSPRAPPHESPSSDQLNMLKEGKTVSCSCSRCRFFTSIGSNPDFKMIANQLKRRC